MPAHTYPQRKRLSLGLEQLEDRLALAVNVSFLNGTLAITGDNTANVITLTRKPSGDLVVAANSAITRTGSTLKPTLNNVAKITIDGRGGNDVLTLKEPGGALPRVTILGGAGNDTIRSGSGGDILNGGAGLDKIFGGGGDDAIVGGAGPDQVSGDAGDDNLKGDAGNDILRGGTGSDTIFGGIDNDNVFGGAGADIIDGEDGNDTLTGDAGDDVLTGGVGTDALFGGAGDDTQSGGAGDDTQAGGVGDDTYAFDPDVPEGRDSLTENAGEGRDTLKFSDVTTVALIVDLGKSAEQVPALNLIFTLSAIDAFENAVGGAMDDIFTGNSLVNQFTGAGGKDTFIHHGSEDGINVVTDMSAVEGDQVFFITNGNLFANELTIDSTAKQLRDAATGTFGFNFIAPVLSATSPYTFGKVDSATQGNLVTSNVNLDFDVGSNADTLAAFYQTIDRTLSGAAGNDRLFEFSAGGNLLLGRDGNDIIIGGASGDTIDGDRGLNNGGNDILTGGGGGDTFEFGQPATGSSPQAFGGDTITDFDDSDSINLFADLRVVAGLGTTTVVIFRVFQEVGTITSANGRVWQAADFT